jgi:large subunit ribosomal protein L9
MEVILLERIEKLGQMGDVVTVKPGYARNFLLPQKKALRATESSKTQFENQRAQLEAENLERRKDAEAVSEKLRGLNVTLIRQAGENGQLYGSVSGRDLADSVTEAGVTVSRGQVMLNRPIKELGLHEVRISLHPEVQVEIKANVARTEDEAAAQRERGLSITEITEESEAAEEAIALAEEALAIADNKEAEAAAIDGMVEEEVAERVAGEAGDDKTDDVPAHIPAKEDEADKP